MAIRATKRFETSELTVGTNNGKNGKQSGSNPKARIFESRGHRKDSCSDITLEKMDHRLKVPKNNR